MRKVLVIASREYQAAVRAKSFLVSLIFMPLLMLSSAGVQVLVDGKLEKRVQRFAVVDRTPGEKLYPLIAAAVQKRNAADRLDSDAEKQPRAVFAVEAIAPSADTPDAVLRQRYDLSEQVREGKLAGFLEIGRDVIAVPAAPADGASPPGGALSDSVIVRYQSNSLSADAFPRWVERVVNEATGAQRCAAAGLDMAQIQPLLHRVPLRVKGLNRRSSSGAVEEVSDEERIIAFLVPAALTGLMFMVVMVAATPLMQGVIEEKAQRIAEVLLGSVRPFELMLGKLLGMTGVSLTLAAVYLGGSYWALQQFGLAEFLSAGLLAWFVVFQVLAALMYGSLFIAIGAACTDAKETQALMIPVVMLISFPLFALRNVLQEPNGTFAFWVSLFPFATPMLMIARLGQPAGVPWWQLALGVALVLGTTLLCVYAAGRIFRIGFLMQGKGAKLSDLARWILWG